jgi:prepilin-type N-terminal cleavage/methylation domain-containing protein
MRQTGVMTAKGFSLIEIMVSISILAIAFLAVVGGAVSVLRINRLSADTLMATAAAENMIEKVRRNSSNLPAYGGLNTNQPLIAAPLTMAQFDFNFWKNRVMAINRGDPGDPAAIPPRPAVLGAIGAVVIAAANPINGITSVTVTVAFPGNLTPIVLNTFVGG